jgi:hypothetical protein
MVRDPLNLNRFEPIDDKVRALERALADALWDENETAVDVLKREIRRLKTLQENGEQYDMPF